MSVNDNKTAVIVQSKPDPKTFTFDHVADHEDTQVRMVLTKVLGICCQSEIIFFKNMCFIIGKKPFEYLKKN